MSKKYIYMFLFFLLFICLSYFYNIKYNIEQVKFVYNSHNLKIPYKISNIQDKKENYDIEVYYPITNIKDIDIKMLDKINQYIDKFKSNLNYNNNKLVINFNTIETNNYTSFIFEINIKKDNTHEFNYIECFNINNDNKEIVEIKDILDCNISELRNNIIETIKQDQSIIDKCSIDEIMMYFTEEQVKYCNFYIDNEYITFCYNTNQISNNINKVYKISISLEQIKLKQN